MILIIIKIVKTVKCCSFNFFTNIYCNEKYDVIFLLNLSVCCKIIIL